MAQVLTHAHTQGLTQTLQNTWIAQVFETSIRTTTEQRLVDNDCCFWAHKWQSNDRNGISTCRKCWGESRSFLKALSFVFFYFHNMLDSLSSVLKSFDGQTLCDISSRRGTKLCWKRSCWEISRAQCLRPAVLTFRGCRNTHLRSMVQLSPTSWIMEPGTFFQQCCVSSIICVCISFDHLRLIVRSTHEDSLIPISFQRDRFVVPLRQ